MKIRNHKTKLLFILCLFLAMDLANSTIISRELAKDKKKGKKPVEDENLNPLEKLMKNLIDFFTEKLKPFKAKKTEDSPEKIIFEMADKKALITIEVSGTQVNVSLVNEYETQQFELENIEFEDEKELIEKEYVDKFIGHLTQVTSKLDDIFKGVQAGLTASKFEGFFGETSFSEIALGKSKDKDSIVFEMTYLNPKLLMDNDKIMGEISRVGESHALRIVTKFFQKTFELAVVTQGYLASESKKLGDGILGHLDSMYYLNENPEGESAQRDFMFSMYKDHLEELLTKNKAETFSVEVGEEEVTISSEDGPALTAKVESKELNGLYFTVIKATLLIAGNQEYHLVLPGESIYTLNALVDKFFLELLDYTKHAANKFNQDEAVKVFE